MTSRSTARRTARKTRVNARLDEEQWRKLAELQRRTGQSVTDIVKASIELYYERARGKQSPAEALRRAAFIGCAEGPKDLSTRYKQDLGRSLGRKA